MSENLLAIPICIPITSDIKAHLHKAFDELTPVLAARVEQAFKAVVLDSQLDELTSDERKKRDISTSPSPYLRTPVRNCAP